MRKWILSALAAWIVLALGMQNAFATSDDAPTGIEPRSPRIPQSVLDFAKQIVESADHGKLPFAIVDKHSAIVAVYRNDGTVAGVSTALLGLIPGDHATAGVGQRAQIGQLNMSDRTTPAGRFDSVPGRNLSGEAVVWMDYGNALAIHRLRPAAAKEKRLQRMASSYPSDKRISAGCVVVPETFYDLIIHPVLGSSRAVVYVMPENSAWQDMWPSVAQPEL